LLPLLLPNRFAALVYCNLKGFVNARDRISLHVREHMAVQVERDADLAMSQALARHLGVDAARKQMRSVGVP
jgi:hypothetical protein